MADSTLLAIQKKVRRITRSPSPSQLSDSDLDEYINTSILYDFPENVRLFSLRTNLTFYTQPGVDLYQTSTDLNSPLYNFKNKYIAVHPPVFLAGIPGFFTQYRDVFYGIYPQTVTIASTNLFGDGVATTFSGIIFAHPCLQNNVVMTALDANGSGMVLVDYPSATQPAFGAFGLFGAPQTYNLSPYGFINYLTGAFTITFPTPPANRAEITSEVVAYNPGKPLSILYYDNQFTIRPVPDKVYSIQIEADVRPTELLATAQEPEIQQWWQYIAILASKKIFEDRMDLDSVQQLMPMLKEQENLVLRTTLTQQANERTVTIYTQGKNFGFGPIFGTGWPY